MHQSADVEFRTTALQLRIGVLLAYTFACVSANADVRCEAHIIALKSIHCIHRKDYCGALAHFRNAVQLNAKYALPAVSEEPGEKVSGELLDHSFGKHQIECMLADRPQMGLHLEVGDRLWRWTCARFNGTGCCGPMTWNASEPMSLSDQIPPRDGSPGRIRISKKIISRYGQSEELLSDSMWRCLAFEFFNSCRFQHGDDLAKQAISGKISRDDYVREVFLTEMAAVDDTRAFYVDVYLPWAMERGALTHPGHWFVNHWWGDKNELFKSCSDENAYPWVPYGQWYDRVERAREMLKIRRVPVLVD